MNDCTKQNLLSLIKNVNKVVPINSNKKYTTRVYLEGFSSYQEKNFTEMILNYTDLITIYGLEEGPSIQYNVRILAMH